MKLVQIFLCIALLGGTLAGAAQTKPGDLWVEVPFAFFVAGQELPAGQYVVTPQGDACIRIFNSQKRGIYVLTHRSRRIASEESKLVFHRYGDTYFLSGVWLTGNTSGRELFPSRAERELANRKAEMELAVVRPAQ